MRVDDLTFKTSLNIVTMVSATGGLGAYVMSHIYETSPIGVTSTCAMITVIGLNILKSKMNREAKFMGLMAAYPVGILTARLFRFRVDIFDPTLSMAVGSFLIAPLALVAALLTSD